MEAGDIPDVAALELESLSSWTECQVTDELDRKAGICLVSTSFSGEVQGWCCSSLLSPEAELLEIAVCPCWRRQGVAEMMLQEMCSLLAAGGGKQIYLEVRSLNIPACRLYAKLGWEKTGKRKKYYTVPDDDALILTRVLVN